MSILCKYENMPGNISVRKNADQVSRYAAMFSAMGTEVRLQVMQLLLSAHPEDLVVAEVQKICGDLTNVILPASRHRRVAWLIFVSEQPPSLHENRIILIDASIALPYTPFIMTSLSQGHRHHHHHAAYVSAEVYT